ncbi:MAG: ABC transporter permease [Desulforegulaceae bacterium]|nr:ABC transporter permease [Desulforegulaceae bacterium]
MKYLIFLSGKTGRTFLNYMDSIFSMSGLLYRILKIFVKGNYSGKKLVWAGIVEQIYFTAVQALKIIVPISLILGTVFFLQFSKFAEQHSLGNIAVIFLLRETGPMISAIVVILRSATAVTTEIGYMNVRHEMDSIQMAGADPLALICLPRVIGITTAILCLFIVFNLVSILGGYVSAWAISDISMHRFLVLIGKSISLTDALAVSVKALAFGVIISIVCLYRGFEAKKSITEVPVKTARAAVECFFYCLIFNVIISVVFSLKGW